MHRLTHRLPFTYYKTSSLTEAAESGEDAGMTVYTSQSKSPSRFYLPAYTLYPGKQYQLRLTTVDSRSGLFAVDTQALVILQEGVVSAIAGGDLRRVSPSSHASAHVLSRISNPLSRISNPIHTARPHAGVYFRWFSQLRQEHAPLDCRQECRPLVSVVLPAGV